MPGARGEAFIEYDGETLPILLTNRALADAEKATGKTAVQIARDTQSSAISVGDVAELLRAGLEYGRRDAGTRGRVYTLNDAWDVMDAVGFTPVAAIVLNALAAVLLYHGEASAEADPPAARS